MDNGLSLADIAAVTDTKNDGMFGGSNGGMWIFALLILLLIGGGGFFGGANGATQADIQRAVDLNSIQQGQKDIAADIQRTAYEQIAATKDAAYNNLGEIRDNAALINAGNSNIINNLTAIQNSMQNCCCETKSMIMENRYLDSQNTATINANTTAQTQKILDAISQNKIESLQAQVNQLQLQSAMCGVIRYPNASTYSAGASPFFGQSYCNGASNI